MKLMNDSKFNMWRSCVAAVHLDRVVSSEEQKWVEEKIEKLPFSDEQRLIIKKDLHNGTSFEECFNKVTDKVDRAFLINTFRVIGHLDKNFSSVEQETFKKFEQIVLGGVNLVEMEYQIQKMNLNESKVSDINNKESIFENIIQNFLKMLKE